MNHKPTLFLLHALGSSRKAWGELVRHFEDDFHVVALDLPGFGDARESPDLTVDGMVEVVVQAIRTSGATRWLLVGHSMGGKVATLVASRALAGESGLFGLNGVVLLAGSPVSPEPMDEDRRRKMIGWAKQATITSVAAREFIDENVGAPLPFYRDQLALSDIVRSAPQAWLAWLERGSLEDWSREVGCLDVPALIMVGDQDGDLGEQGQLRTNAKTYPRAEVRVLEGAGHMLPLERPETIAAGIRDVWNAVATAAPQIPAAFARTVASARVSRRMRAILAKRAIADPETYVAKALNSSQLQTLRAIAKCVVPQCGPEVDLAIRLDAQLGAGKGDGWRHAEMPSDLDAYRRALDGLAGFENLPGPAQIARLHRIAQGDDHDPAWSADKMKLWFQDACADLVRLWIAHPATMARIGFDGFANGGDGVRKQGFERLAAGEREPWEPSIEVQS
ncbi:alpha/beta fold hydrolase [uncultured Xylophilus sp.]|uniref:alpha/beta fold hydrolase n=1 Tax=uncultured Xylophilus sp. TaxID=296832 RepID=UPI0025EA13B4|nr:alpha/beta fold hydrolase [uncultured Xylophilus sp.]